MKRSLSLLLALLLVGLSLGSTVALAEDGATNSYTAFAMMNGEYALDETLAWKTWTEMFGLDVQMESVLGADLTERRNLTLASGDYPDFFIKSGFSLSDQSKYGAQGKFIPIEDMIREYMPNLSAVLDERDGWAYLTASDGHIYSLPEISTLGGAMTTYWINKKWMDTLGLSEPKSFDELYEVLKAFKEGDPNGNGEADEIPLTATDAVPPELLMAYQDYAYDRDTKTAVIDGQLTYIPLTDSWKEFIAYLTKLYSEGLLDKNAFTQAHEQQGAIGQSGDVLGSFFDAGAFLTVGRDNDDDYIALTPFYEGTYPLSVGITPGTLVITDFCENPEVLLTAMDYFYSEAGGILAWMGVEGATYNIGEDGYWRWIVDGEYGDDVAEVRASATIQGAANHPSIQPEFWMTGMSAEVDPDEVYLNGQRQKVAENGVIALPMMSYTEQENEEIATLTTDINAYINEYMAQVVTGAQSLDETWDTYVATMNNMGVERLVQIYNDVYARATAE